MTAHNVRTQADYRWLNSIRYKGGAAVRSVVIFSAAITLCACLGATTTSSSSYSQNLLNANTTAPAKSSEAAKISEAADTPVSGALGLIKAARSAAAEPPAAAPETRIVSAVEASGKSVIDQQICTQGLLGDLATGQAGLALLAANGLGLEEETAELSDQVTPVTAALSGLIIPAPSAGAVESPPSGPLSISLNMSAGATEALLIAAYKQTGRHYKAGGISPGTGFDSSGFTRWVYGQRGINLPRDIKQQIAGGLLVSKEELRPGDLLVYHDPTNKSESYHVGIYTGQGIFLHAAAKAGVVTETAAFSPQYLPYFVGGRRYYDDPQAAPLSDSQKMAAASSAVKLALSELGPNDKPDLKVSAPKRGKPGKKKK